MHPISYCEQNGVLEVEAAKRMSERLCMEGRRPFENKGVKGEREGKKEELEEQQKKKKLCQIM